MTVTNLDVANLHAAQRHALGLCQKAQAPEAGRAEALVAMAAMAEYIAALETALDAALKAPNQ